MKRDIIAFVPLLVIGLLAAIVAIPITIVRMTWDVALAISGDLTDWLVK